MHFANLVLPTGLEPAFLARDVEFRSTAFTVSPQEQYVVLPEPLNHAGQSGHLYGLNGGTGTLMSFDTSLSCLLVYQFRHVEIWSLLWESNPLKPDYETGAIPLCEEGMVLAAARRLLPAIW